MVAVARDERCSSDSTSSTQREAAYTIYGNKERVPSADSDENLSPTATEERTVASSATRGTFFGLYPKEDCSRRGAPRRQDSPREVVFEEEHARSREGSEDQSSRPVSCPPASVKRGTYWGMYKDRSAEVKRLAQEEEQQRKERASKPISASARRGTFFGLYKADSPQALAHAAEVKRARSANSSRGGSSADDAEETKNHTLKRFSSSSSFQSRRSSSWDCGNDYGSGMTRHVRRMTIGREDKMEKTSMRICNNRRDRTPCNWLNSCVSPRVTGGSAMRNTSSRTFAMGVSGQLHVKESTVNGICPTYIAESPCSMEYRHNDGWSAHWPVRIPEDTQSNRLPLRKLNLKASVVEPHEDEVWDGGTVSPEEASEVGEGHPANTCLRSSIRECMRPRSFAPKSPVVELQASPEGAPADEHGEDQFDLQNGTRLSARLVAPRVSNTSQSSARRSQPSQVLSEARPLLTRAATAPLSSVILSGSVASATMATPVGSLTMQGMSPAASPAARSVGSLGSLTHSTLRYGYKAPRYSLPQKLDEASLLLTPSTVATPRDLRSQELGNWLKVA